MALKIEELMRKITLPKRYFDNVFIISDKFREETDSFVSFLNQCNGKEYKADEEAKIKHESIGDGSNCTCMLWN